MFERIGVAISESPLAGIDFTGYEGKHVVIRNKVVIASNEDRDMLFEEVDMMGFDRAEITYYKVPLPGQKNF